MDLGSIWRWELLMGGVKFGGGGREGEGGKEKYVNSEHGDGLD